MARLLIDHDASGDDPMNIAAYGKSARSIACQPSQIPDLAQPLRQLD
jgi:hypothetical protein